MQILYEGTFHNTHNLKSLQEKFYIRLLTIFEIPMALALQDLVYNHMPNKKLLVKDTYEEMQQAMHQDGAIFGVFNEKHQLVAHRYINAPGADHSNLGHDLNFDKEDLKQVVHLETTVVHPDYRGNRLQSITLDEAIKYSTQRGYQHLLCTVSPNNFHSLYNIMSGGLKIQALKQKYGDRLNQKGVWRFILHRDLILKPAQSLANIFLVDPQQIEIQCALIKAGYVGYALSTIDNKVNYGQFI